MNIEYTFLNDSYIPTIYETWIEAFAEYHVDMSYLTLDRFINRSKMDRVDFKYCVGAFHNNKMVGFINIGIDKWGNEIAAFDAGTGVIKDYRGQQITSKMFDYSVWELKKKNVKRFVLEVIQENSSAINAYTKSGFKVSREFICYKLDFKNFQLEINTNKNIRVKLINKTDFKSLPNFSDWDISWEYNNSAIDSIQNEILIYCAYIQNQCVGYIVYYPNLEWIFQLAVNKAYRKNQVESTLLNELYNSIKKKTSAIKFNNILNKHPLNDILIKKGFEIYTTQFEMELDLKNDFE